MSGNMLGKWQSNILNVPRMYLVVKGWVNWTSVFNVFTMYSLVSIGPCPQCGLMGLIVTSFLGMHVVPGCTPGCVSMFATANKSHYKNFKNLYNPQTIHKFKTLRTLNKNKNTTLFQFQGCYYYYKNDLLLWIESIVIKVENLAMVWCWRSSPVWRVMIIGQGRENVVPFLQPQGDVQLHLPPTSIHLMKYYLLQGGMIWER